MAVLGLLVFIIASGIAMMSIFALFKPAEKISWLNSRKKAAFTLVGSVVGGFILIGILAVNDPSVKSNSSAPTNQTTAVTSAEIAPTQSVVVDDIEYKIAALEKPNSVGLSDEKAGEGGVLVALILSAKNVGAEPVKASAIKDIKLIDEKGVEYNPDSGKTSQFKFYRDDLNMKVISDLNPDIAVKDAYVFEVSKTKFDQNTWRASVDGEQFLLPSKK